MIIAGVLGLIFPILGYVFFFRKLQWRWNGKQSQAFILVVPICMAVSFVTHHIAYGSMVNFKEIWNSPSQKVILYEKWTEESETCTTDDDGSRSCTTYYINHPEYWRGVDEYDVEHEIEKPEYHHWARVWGGETHVNIIRIDKAFFGGRGDKLEAYWDRTFDKMFPLAFIMIYENKVRASDTVWEFAEVDEETKEKFPRPADVPDTRPLMTYGVTVSAADDLFMRRMNAIWGNRYQLHNMIFLFNVAQYPDRSIVETVTNAWEGPNKNELITFIGLDGDKKPQWCDVVSWMDDTTIHSLIRQDVIEMDKFSAKNMADILKPRLASNWKRKEFADFDYIHVSVPAWTYLVIALLNIVSVGAGGAVIESKVYDRRSAFRRSKYRL